MEKNDCVNYVDLGCERDEGNNETKEYYIRHIDKMVREIKSLKSLKELYYELLWIKLHQ